MTCNDFATGAALVAACIALALGALCVIEGGRQLRLTGFRAGRRERTPDSNQPGPTLSGVRQ